MDKVKWKNICEDKDKRPIVQEYHNWEELPPIPISLPIKGAIGTKGQIVLNEELTVRVFVGGIVLLFSAIYLEFHNSRHR